MAIKFRLGGPPNHTYPLDEMLHANAEDEHFCAWARSAEPGQTYCNGGEEVECIAEGES